VSVRTCALLFDVSYGARVRKAIVLGGNGQVGSAAALKLISAGWEVTATGQALHRFPQGLRDVGVRFIRSDRYAADDLHRLLREGADVVVDCVGYTAEHARMLLPFQHSIGSLVFISSKAVYIDDQGRHSNSDEPPAFAAPVTETQPTVAPSNIDHNSREGYGANKVAAERVLLDSGMRVSVLRPSRIHGIEAARPREWVFVKRVLDRRRQLLLANAGQGVNHPTAAVNLAALVEFCATNPGTRILNSADPDAPDGLTISRIVATRAAMRTRSARRSTGSSQQRKPATPLAHCHRRTIRTSCPTSTTPGRTRGCPGGSRKTKSERARNVRELGRLFSHGDRRGRAGSGPRPAGDHRAPDP
jgi:nucleoside-diphosphate-sugar epimerase